MAGEASAAAQLAMQAKSGRRQAVDELAGIVKDRRALMLGQKLAQWNDYTPEGLKSFIQSSGLNLQDPAHAEVFNKAVTLTQQFQNFAKSKAEEERASTAENRAQTLFDLGLKDRETRIANEKEDRAWTGKERGWTEKKNLFDIGNMAGNADLERRTKEAQILKDQKMADQYAANAAYINAGKEASATDLKIDAEKVRRMTYGVIANVQKATGGVGNIEYNSDTGTAIGAIPTDKIDSIEAGLSSMGYALIPKGTTKIDVKGKWSDVPGTMVEIVYVGDGSQQQPAEQSAPIQDTLSGLLQRSKTQTPNTKQNDGLDQSLKKYYGYPGPNTRPNYSNLIELINRSSNMMSR